MQKLDMFQINYANNQIGVWLTQPNDRVVFVCRSMWEWMQACDSSLKGDFLK